MWPFGNGRDRGRSREAPTWPAGPRAGKRILLEHPDATTRQLVQRGLEDRGYEVLTCAGPGEPGGDGISCPVLRQERCPAISGSDVVVTGLPLSEPRFRMIVHRTLRDDPDRPVIVEASHQDVDRHGQDAITYHLCPLTMQALTQVLEAAVPVD